MRLVLGRRGQDRAAGGQRGRGEHARRARAPENQHQGHDCSGEQTGGGHELAQHAATVRAAALLRAGAVGLDALTQAERRHRLRDGGGDERATALGELVVEGVHWDVLVGGNHGLSL